MNDAAYIVAGWLGSASAIGLYALALRRRSRRAAGAASRRAL